MKKARTAATPMRTSRSTAANTTAAKSPNKPRAAAAKATTKPVSRKRTARTSIATSPVTAPDPANAPLETLASGRFLRLLKRGRWEYADRANAHGAVAIVAITDQQELMLTEQYRVPVGRRVIDLPAGLSGDVPGQEDEALLLSAQRELEEETGCIAPTWRYLDACPSSPGLSSEVITYFLAQQATSIGAGGGVEHEQIVVHRCPVTTIEDFLKSARDRGCLIDAKVYVALYFAHHSATAPNDGSTTPPKSRRRRS